MTGIEHSLRATGMLALFFYVGKHIGEKKKVEHIVECTFDMLEKNNMIRVSVDKNGEKEILPLDKC